MIVSLKMLWIVVALAIRRVSERAKEIEKRSTGDSQVLVEVHSLPANFHLTNIL